MKNIFIVKDHDAFRRNMTLIVNSLYKVIDARSEHFFYHIYPKSNIKNNQI